MVGWEGSGSYEASLTLGKVDGLAVTCQQKPQHYIYTQVHVVNPQHYMLHS